MEIECAKWLQSSIFQGGLQTSQVHYSYNGEKEEDHCSSPGSTTPDKTNPSPRLTLSDHTQPFLQAIADNTTQDHTVKDFLCQMERCCKQYHLITPITFPPGAPCGGSRPSSSLLPAQTPGPRSHRLFPRHPMCLGRGAGQAEDPPQICD
ncbi:hypothetical protein J4Q44_G00015630 [Coregonus suidteri]|uniref:Uncharacterized protein n=1 Tax=Coregonus suidteri TaxID=861788 RepID=A0AAN8R7Q3_9TELE